MKSLIWICWLLMVSIGTSAQLLAPAGKLTDADLERWMRSGTEMASMAAVVDELFESEAEAIAFEQLGAREQDQKIAMLLKQKGLAEKAQALANEVGWPSVGDYIRFSTNLGNAIAAYFVLSDLGNPTSDQLKTLEGKVDPAILQVPKSDIFFIEKHQVRLQHYIQSYSAQ